MTILSNRHPHGNQPLLEAGPNLENANGVVILLHGRGSPAANMIRLSQSLAPDPASGRRIAWLAPQAENNTWYPYRFLVPVEQNEPHLSSALSKIDELVDASVGHGIHSKQVALVGFSQGACLALEYVARGSRPVAGVAAFAGGLIGDPTVERQPIPDLTGTRVFLGVGELDEHIDVGIAERSARLLREAGASVDFRTYPGITHTILDDEIDAARDVIANIPVIGPRPAVS
jgi:predicted esterase